MDKTKLAEDNLFKEREDELYISGKKVIRGWESLDGWYWFAVKEVRTQDSLMPDGNVAENDIIYYGFVQGLEDEWVNFSLAELESSSPMVWEIPKENLPYSGRRD